MQKVIRRISRFIDMLLQRAFRVFPVKKNYIVFESEGDFWDNARAFYEYLVGNELNKKYRLIWIVHEPGKYPPQENVVFVSRFSYGLNLKANYYIATAGCFIFTHPYWLKKWRREQTVINLTHSSMMLKAGGKKNISDCFDYMLCASNAVKELKKKTYHIKDDQAVLLGGPRIDLLFNPIKDISMIVSNYKGEKIILAMSTFKQSKLWKDSNRVDKFALNVIHTMDELIELNNFLREWNTFMIVKIHHLQDTSFIEPHKLDRIVYLFDSDLQSKGIQLYEMLGKADALLTDYSSVFYDYLIINRPIGFLISDMEDYTRGFCIDNPMEHMVGSKLKNKDQLYEFIISVNQNVDLYRSQRESLRDEVHIYQDSKNSERLLNWLESNEFIKPIQL
jgi:CDP-glycerol glycerophosphotransferase (TagB/SpsB family)